MYRSSAYLGFLVGDNKSRRVPRIHRGIVRGAEPTVQTAPLVSSAPAGGILATPSVRGRIVRHFSATRNCAFLKSPGKFARTAAPPVSKRTQICEGKVNLLPSSVSESLQYIPRKPDYTQRFVCSKTTFSLLRRRGNRWRLFPTTRSPKQSSP